MNANLNVTIPIFLRHPVYRVFALDYSRNNIISDGIWGQRDAADICSIWSIVPWIIIIYAHVPIFSPCSRLSTPGGQSSPVQSSPAHTFGIFPLIDWELSDPLQ